MRRWDGLVEGYLASCRQRGLAEATIKQRSRELDRWGNWMKRRRPKPNLDALDPDLLILYIRKRTVFHARGTVCGVVSDMRSMGEYLVREGIWDKNPLKWIRGPKLDPRARIPKRIGKKHLQGLWDAAANRTSEYNRYRWLAILAIVYGTGVRRGDLAELDVSDWNREEGILRLRGRKVGREVMMPLCAHAARCIEAYLPYRHNHLEKIGRQEEAALFVNKDGARLSREGVSRGIHRLAKGAGVPLVSLHQFRHTCASDLLEKGVPVATVQQILGHAVITSTMRYLDIADPERRKAMARHPINGMLNGREKKGHDDA